MTAPGPLYQFAPLAAAAGLTMSEAAALLGLSGSTWKQYRDEGMSLVVADRRAVQLGFHPFEVWPEMLEHAIADVDDLDEVEAERREHRRHRGAVSAARYRQRNPGKYAAYRAAYRDRERSPRRSA